MTTMTLLTVPDFKGGWNGFYLFYWEACHRLTCSICVQFQNVHELFSQDRPFNITTLGVGMKENEKQDSEVTQSEVR